MNATSIVTTTLSCSIANLRLSDAQGRPISNLSNQPLQLQVDLFFADSVNGELLRLLLPLGLFARVSFYAEPAAPAAMHHLGDVTLSTTADTASYTVTHPIAHPLALGLQPDQTYQITASVRVGSSPIAIPSILRSYGNGLELAGTSATPPTGEVGADPEFAVASKPEAKPKASRRTARSESAV